MSFNYLGQFDQVLPASSIFQGASESTGASRSFQGHRSHLLDIGGSIDKEQLRINWTYSQNVHRRTTIEAVAQKFISSLRSLITHCLSSDVGSYTPSDFPLAKLNFDELEQVLSNLQPEEITETNRKNIEDIYPLSPMQQGMLFHTLYAPDSGVYFVQFSYTLKGSLQVEAFQQAWQQIIDRYQVLRTVFIWEDQSQPLQVVYRQVKLPLEILDWQGLSHDEQQQQLSALLICDRHRGFQLSQAPLMRFTLIQMDENVYQFVWSLHHLLIDGWSLPLVLKEFLAIYEACARGQNFYLEPTVSYRNYIAWLEKQDKVLAELFWKQTLKGFNAPTPLIVDSVLESLCSEEESYNEQQIYLSGEMTVALQSLARQHQLTLNTLVQGAWAFLLSRYSGKTDVVFGVTVSGRPTTIKGVASIVGPLINTLPMRVIVSSNDSVLPWLKQIQNQQVEMSQYEYSSLVLVQGWSEVLRGLPLFESIVVFENYPIDVTVREQNLFNLEISDVYSFNKTNYPLTLVSMPGAQLSLRLGYSTHRFDAVTIDRMLNQLQIILEGIVVDPDQRLSSLSILSVTEQQQLLIEWNDTKADYPKDLCIHQLFEAQVEQTPDAVALVFGDEQLTYQELNSCANKTAHHLQLLGVKPETLVGLCVERSLEMVVGLLGILKAGGAYVPLDPAYPQERLAFILEDAQVSILLTQEQVINQLPEHGAKIVFLDRDWQAIAQQDEQNLASKVTDKNLAYVIYTSGSTGKPKGVLVTHSGLCNLAQAQIETFGVSSESRILQFASLSFDASISEVVTALGSGATLCIETQDSLLPGLALIQLLRNYYITHITLPPSALAVLPIEELPLLQTIIVAGEVCSPEIVASWALGRQFFNAYGPTEATVCATVAKCENSRWKLPIGRPILNTQIYLLDEQLIPVPIGVPGELYIGSKGLARGYLNCSDLTALRFIPNPFGDEPGTRLYKTGDMGRYLADGNIEYLGRIDNQVKIRGFRIELEEIEIVLSQHLEVLSSVLIVREDIPGDKRLVAYLIPKQQPAPTASNLRHFLKQQLPEYMVPSAFVILDALPLTLNGKIDRRALPTPNQAGLELQDVFVSPRDTLELKLAHIWENILNLKPIGSSAILLGAKN